MSWGEEGEKRISFLLSKNHTCGCVFFLFRRDRLREKKKGREEGGREEVEISTL